MRQEVTNFSRKDLFEHYNANDNPFSFVTTRIDITNIIDLCKKYGKYYASIGYFLTKAINNVEQFKYSYEEGKIYKYDVLNPSFVDIREDGNIGFYAVPFDDDYHKFMEQYGTIKEQFKNGKYVNEEKTGGEVWLSCEPWFNFSACVPPFNKKITIPQLIWDKFIFENDRCYVNLMIMSHHGFVDGFHIGKLIQEIEKVISEIKI